jgi:serine/threonine-protein kinase
MEFGVGAVIDGKYELTAVLGTGGMGVVYEGRNLRIARRVAIKVLNAASAENDEAVARFEQEAQAAGRIGSKHIVEVLDLGHLPNGDRYMVMEFLEGESLRERMDRLPRAAPLQVAPLVLQLLDGLSAAHAAGIVHRDLKPENVFLQRTRDGDFVKLLDFGISKFTRDTTFDKTRTGSIFGTPYYMAPEHATGSKEVDHRVDIYAVGVIMYEALAGCLPFDGEVFTELLFKIALETPQPLDVLRPDLPAAWVQLVQRAMARKPAERFGTAREFHQALAALVASPASASVPLPVPTPSTNALPGPPAPSPGLGTVRSWTHSQPAAPATAQRASSRAPIALVGLVVAALAGAGGWWLFGMKRAVPVASIASSSARVVAAPAPPLPPLVFTPSPAVRPTPGVSAAPSPAQVPVLPQPARRTSAPAAAASSAAAPESPAPEPAATSVRRPRRWHRDL